MKKRFFAVVLCLVLLASFFAVPASAASVVKVMKVNVSGARLRKVDLSELKNSNFYFPELKYPLKS